MGYRRSPDRLAAAEAWARFTERNAAVISAAGLPPTITATIGSWDDFLMSGSVAGDPDGFTRHQLAETQYSFLVELASNYFSAGYEFYTPLALRVEDQQRLRARFDGAS